MPRYIDADEAFKVLSVYYKHKTGAQDSALHQALSLVPTVDPIDMDMSDLIERQAVLDLITENWYGSNAFYINHIKELPCAKAGSNILCKNCIHAVISAEMEHKDGDVTNYYMCEYWHRPTDECGYCHKAQKGEQDP